MKINEVEQRVGITKKNIRFYEDQGLLNPERNHENGYRDYSEEDVILLLKIKLLRKLSVPIEEIKKVLNGQLTLKGCMERHKVLLGHEQNNLEVMQKMCVDIAESQKGINDIDVDGFLNTMVELEKGGVSFVDIKKTDKTAKKAGAIISAAVMTVFIILWDVMMVVLNRIDPIPTGVLLGFTVLPSLIIIGIIIALIQRIREIEGGEEDEARKY